jgi:hypothetical protein
MIGRYDKAGASAVALLRNQVLSYYVNLGETRDITRRFMLSTMKDVEEFGARDTAVLEILERVLDEIYGA